MATRKFHELHVSLPRECCFPIKKGSRCPIRQILKPIVPFILPLLGFATVGWNPPLFFTDLLAALSVWSRLVRSRGPRRGCVLRLQLLGRQSRGRGTWKRTPRVNPYSGWKRTPEFITHSFVTFHPEYPGSLWAPILARACSPKRS